MVLPRASALLLLTIVAAGAGAGVGGCAESTEGAGQSEDEVRLGVRPDAAADAASTSDASDGGAAADATAEAAASAGPPGPITTTYGPKLAAIGLDVQNLPALHDLPMGQKMKVMKTFNETMNVSCDACHDVADFAAPTRQKEIATEAWEVITRKLTMGDGSALYCDSCHQGKFHFLDRENAAGIPLWMKTNFVDKLQRKDGEAMSCGTCHGGHAPSEPPPSTH